MFKKLLNHCAAMSGRQVLGSGLLLAILFETLTVILRFGYRFQTTRDTAALGAFTLGLRVHHGYIGIFLLLLGWCFPPGLRNAVWIVAIGLILSDVAHHFIVLWYFTGSPQFDFVYPSHPYWSGN